MKEETTFTKKVGDNVIKVVSKSERIFEIEDEAIKAGGFKGREDILHSYSNGNHQTVIFKDGTRYRETFEEDEDHFTYRVAENADVLITKWCDANCAYCHEGATINGKHAELFKDGQLLPIFTTWNPGSEIAIGGGNALAHPDIVEFTKQLTALGAVCNITVNQKHIWDDKLELMVKEGYVKGIGISLTNSSSMVDLNRIRYLKTISHNNVVIHVIAGIFNEKDLDFIVKGNLKTLILGYKDNVGRGVGFKKENKDSIDKNIEWLHSKLSYLKEIAPVMSFDNLALAQLDAKEALGMSDEEWAYRFQGKDYGDPNGHDAPCTFYFDAVNKMIGRSSTQPYDQRVPYTNQSFEEAFKDSLSNYKINEGKYGEIKE